MRITGGSLLGRRLRVPAKGMRPTQDRVREALFGILGSRVDGCRFLDLYAGSGSVGLEAWSRGASEVTWVEKDRRSLTCLKQNVAAFCGSDGRVISGDVERVLGPRLAGSRFDIMFADPPYASATVLPGVLGRVKAGDMLEPGGVFIMEEASSGPVQAADGWVLAEDRTYGRTGLRFYVNELSV